MKNVFLGFAMATLLFAFQSCGQCGEDQHPSDPKTELKPVMDSMDKGLHMDSSSNSVSENKMDEQHRHNHSHESKSDHKH